MLARATQTGTDALQVPLLLWEMLPSTSLLLGQHPCTLFLTLGFLSLPTCGHILVFTPLPGFMPPNLV